MAVDVDLDGERQPGLQANVDQPDRGIEKVIIKHPLLPRSADEFGSFGTGNQREGRTGLQGTEDADEALGDTLFADEAPCPFLLAEPACAINVGASRFALPVLGVLDQAVGVLRRRFS